MKKNWKRKIIGGLCLSSAAFVFQACYGMPQDFGNDLLIEGIVKSKKTGLPVDGIKVSISNQMQYTATNSDGRFGFYIPQSDTVRIKFEDTSTRAIPYLKKDSLLSLVYQKHMCLTIELEENDENVKVD